MSLRFAIANPNYSSWSLRVWLKLQCHNISIEVTSTPTMPAEDFGERIGRYMPARSEPQVTRYEYAKACA